jgi:hypothetical protein
LLYTLTENAASQSTLVHQEGQQDAFAQGNIQGLGEL